MLDLRGKKVLVTGSSQGIGKEIAKALSDCGATVYAHGTKISEKLKQAAEYIGAEKYFAADLSDIDETRALKNQTGDVDILILNASVQYKEKWDEIGLDTFEKQVNTNLRSTLILMQEYIPSMKENGFGRVITVGSVNQHRTHPELGLYSATKCAVMKLVENVAKDVASFGVTVNNIAPGAIATPRNEEVYNDEQKRKAVEAVIPTGRFGTPCDCVGTVLLLCSDAGEYITGADILIDGGMHL